MAFSVAANVYRSELKRIPAVSLSLDQVAEPSRPFVHDAELDGAARDEAVRRAVLALPENYREPLILFYFHEMDLATAAATMGIPEGTMKARLSRGRALLKQRFPQLRDQLENNTEEAGADSVAQSPPGQSQSDQSPTSQTSEGLGGLKSGWKRLWKSRQAAMNSNQQPDKLDSDPSLGGRCLASLPRDSPPR